MANGYPYPSHQPLARSNNEADMVVSMINNLNIKSPYRKYPPLGVPCANGSSTFQLNLRREKWWEMLQEHAWKEKVMMQKLRLDEEKRERQKHEQTRRIKQEERTGGVKNEQMKHRKDSLVVEEKDVASANTSVGITGEEDNASSAVYDSSGEEEDVENAELYQFEQAKHVQARKMSEGKNHKEKSHNHGNRVRRVRPL